MRSVTGCVPPAAVVIAVGLSTVATLISGVTTAAWGNSRSTDGVHIAASSSASPSSVVSASLFGMQVVSIAQPNPAPAALAGLGSRAGTGSVNLLLAGSEWAYAQPSHSREPDFTPLERSVEAARKHGALTSMAQVFGTPSWAVAKVAKAPPRDGLPPSWTAVPNRGAWKKYLGSLASHFRGQIGAYSVWPEANLSDMWGGSPADLADLTLDAYEAIRAADPSAKIVAASTGLRQRGWSTWYRAYLVELKKRGWPVDVFAFHGYTASRGTPTTRVALIRQFKSVLSSVAAPQRELWDGEVNWGFAGPGASNPHVRMDGDWRAAAYTSRTYLDALRLGVSRVYWSAWMPAFPAGTGYGITLYPGTRGAKGLKTTYDWVVGKRWGGCTYVSGLVTCAVSAGRSVWKIRWSETTAKKVVVTRGYTRVCTLENGCRTVRVGKAVTITGSPVRMGA